MDTSRSLALFRQAASAWAAAGDGAETAAETTRTVAANQALRTAVFVEGASDQAAVEAAALAKRRDLTAEGVVVVSLGGVTNISKFTDVLGPAGLGLKVAGLCDAAEERYFHRAIERARLADLAGLAQQPLARAGMETLGFWVCDADLEQELIRALGTDVVESVIEAHGDLRALETFRKQPAQLERSEEQRLRRFLGTTSGRKINYGSWLVEALNPDQMPRPLTGLLNSV